MIQLSSYENKSADLYNEKRSENLLENRDLFIKFNEILLLKVSF